MVAIEATTNFQAGGLGVLQDLPFANHSSNQIIMKYNKPKHTHDTICMPEIVRGTALQLQVYMLMLYDISTGISVY